MSNTFNRESLARIAALVRPALATQDYIPALSHIKFAGGYATAYDDVSAISVRADIEIERCIPGDLLIRSLASFNAEQVLLQQKDATLLVSSGRSKLKLPTLPLDKHPLEMPDWKRAPAMPLTESILTGIERCLLSVGSDPTHPAQMGVTLDELDSKSVLYSTNNFTISRFTTKTKSELPGGAAVILPTFFAEQLITLARAFPAADIDLHVLPGALVAHFEGKATEALLLTKTVVDTEPLDFGKVIARHSKAVKADDLIKIPDSFDASFGRALLVLSGEMDKTTKVEAHDNGLQLHSTSSLGDADDIVTGDFPDFETFLVDPALVVRASKTCTHMACYPKALLLASEDAGFIHLIAHCAV